MDATNAVTGTAGTDHPDATDAVIGTAAPLDGTPPTFLRAALHPNWAFHVLKHLHPHDAGRLEACHSTITPLLRVAATRMNAASSGEASKEGATFVAFGADRDAGWITWARELLLIYQAVARTRVRGAKMMVSAGERHSLVASGNTVNDVWSFGFGLDGQLGHEAGGIHAAAGSEMAPRRVEALGRVTVRQVGAGKAHSMALTVGGGVFTWGYGSMGVLGHGNTRQQNVPKRVGSLSPATVTYIAAGERHSTAVTEEGTVYTWGFNHSGQLGLGDHGADTHRLVPAEVLGVDGVIAVAAGGDHSLVLSWDGKVMACGSNMFGQLGVGDTEARDVFTVVAGLRSAVDIDAGEKHSIAVTAEGRLFTWGTGRAIGGRAISTRHSVPTKVARGGIEEVMVVRVAAGKTHSMALTATGDLWTWGQGGIGQLGHGGKENLAVPRVVNGIEGAVVGMAGGDRHSLVTTAEGRVLAFGSGANARLGLGAGVVEALTPTAIDGITMGEGEEGKEGREGKEGNGGEGGAGENGPIRSLIGV
jgi:alpha-tubulin suppressor-like RCC1 family protein